MSNIKICSQCSVSKSLVDFYFCAGQRRSECKACTIKRNVKYQQRVKAWNYRYDNEARKSYMREYYKKNKAKYSKYRKEFRERYPEYYKDYFKKRNNT
jgi:hypothetical protein